MARERKWGMFKIEGTASEFLSDATGIIEELRDEMQEGMDNMSGTNLENTNKYSMYEEAYVALEDAYSRVEEGDLPEAVAGIRTETMEDRQREMSRARRLGNAINRLEAVLQVIQDKNEEMADLDLDEASDKEKELQELLDGAYEGVQEAIDICQGVEFPGFYG